MKNISFDLMPSGSFSLEAADSFGFGAREAQPWDGSMRMAFVLDDFSGHAALSLTQDDSGLITARGFTDGSVEFVQGQVKRILGLDYDGEEWEALGERDPVVGMLQKRFSGMRPVLFHSPYEGGAWSMLSMRQGRAQSRKALENLCISGGQTFDIDGKSMHAFPLPQRLLELEAVPGVADLRLERMKGLAREALSGRLAPKLLRQGNRDEVLESLQQIPGVGPFTAGLMLVRASGVRDTLPQAEPRTLKHAQALYGEQVIPDYNALEKLAETWSPWRTWVMVMIRVDAARA